MNHLEEISRPSRRRLLLSGFWVFLFSFLLNPTSSEAAACKPSIASLVSLEGEVTLKKTGEDSWQQIKVQETFCPGDTIQVGENSRALVLLSNHSLVRLDSQTLLAFTDVQKKGNFWIELLKGIGHFISKVPRRLNISTPYVNAMVEGTEFLISVGSDQTFLSVFEGEVLAKNDQGALKLSSGQSAEVKASQAPVIRQVVRPRDAVQWALHYPVILQFDPNDFEGHSSASWQSRMSKSIAFFEQGAATQAFDALSEITEKVGDPRFFTYRAALRLSVGQVGGARGDLEQVLVLAPQDGDALALLAMIAVVQNDKAEALRLSKKAVSLAPNALGPLLARSYALQADFQLSAARKVMEAGVAHTADNAMAWSRLAELRLMFRDLEGALDAARKAVAINHGIARTQSVLGFAHLIQINIQSSKAAFEKAIALDQGAALPRLGLGLAKIREGDLKQGRREIEIAAMLDPSHSLIRSYLGKAYYEEKKDGLAVEQYSMAIELDPFDPTAWFYDAILKQSTNRPVEALRSFRKSIERNDNRAVYRSRLLLDEDQAARSAGLARIYNDLGFGQLALNEGWKSLTSNPGNYSAHRLLADSYASLPRHEIARSSELLQAQLRQSININPMQPQLAETSLGILEGSGPSDLSFNEFNPLFARNRTAAQFNSVAGNNSTWGDDLVVAGIQGGLSYSVGQFHYETEGFRQNNDLKHDIYYVFAQAELTPKLNIQAEFRRRETEHGDIELNFDPADFSTEERFETRQDTARIGGRFESSAQSDIIFSLIYSDREQDQSFRPGQLGPATDEQIDKEAYQTEAQYLFLHDRFNVTVGVGRYEINEVSHGVFDWTLVFGLPCPPSPPFPPVPCEEDSKVTLEADTAYIYANIVYPEVLTWTLGLSYDSIEEPGLDLEEFSPKVGLQWDIADSIRLRLVYMETVKRRLMVEQTIEPTQVAGFNQFFDEPNGTLAERYGIGIDAILLDDFYGGVEGSRRDAEIPNFGSVQVSFFDRREDLHRAYLYWTPNPEWGLSTEYQFEKVKDNTSLGPAKVETTTVPIEIRHFRQEGVFVEFSATYLRQKVNLGPMPLFDKMKEEVLILDTAIGYRLPKRRGIVSLEIKNLLDKEFLFQDTGFLGSEPASPRFIPEQTILLRLTLSI